MKKFFLGILIVAVLQNILPAQETQDTTVTKFIVGIKEAPPFIIKNNNFYSGVSIDLWALIANDLDIIYDYKFYREDQISQMIDDVQKDKINIAINPLTITSQRLKKVDFTVPFFSSYMVIALPKKNQGFFAFIKTIISKKLWASVFILFIVVFSFGLLIWLVERKKNKSFQQNYKGLGDGFWWAAVTMTTVGYGDKVPKTRGGRLLAIIWMFTSVVLISSLTGSIAAALTIRNFESKINSLQDLKKLKIGTIVGSSSYEFLLKHNITPYKADYHTIEEGLEDVINGNIDGFVYDQAILNYIINKNNWGDKIYISPYKFTALYYSFAMPKHSPWLDSINYEIIKFLESVNWIAIREKYDVSQ